MPKAIMNGTNFDITSFDRLAASQEAGVSVSLIHPGTGDDLGVTIVVAGPDSKLAKNAERRLMDRRIKGRKVKQLTAAELQEEGLKKLAIQVISWDGMIENGKVLECNAENVLRVFDLCPWIAEQVAETASDRAAFFTD